MAPSSRSLNNTKAILSFLDSYTCHQWSRYTITHADKDRKRSCAPRGRRPVNLRMLEIYPSTISGEELIVLRRRWDRFHTARNFLNFFGFASALVGALSESTDSMNSCT